MMHLSKRKRHSQLCYNEGLNVFLKILTCITCTAVQMVIVELRNECITLSFLLEECQITESFSAYIVNFVRPVRFTSPDMMLVDKDLHAVQAWKKAS
ncbi:hypothetical protein TNCV_2207141 [Trichonephila clavipes]|uniref:Uncharacterized protein n=1 Tax=Trichonephila clavipes TaxID=2585209 RepID=A0A8X6SE00_TRICX|nr:hypothetical protein TNCV_2207141 [Trichonephila clavipes]